MSANVNYRVPRPDENGMNETDRPEDNETGSDSGEKSETEPRQDQEYDKQPKRTLYSVVINFLVCILVGFVFGFVAEKSRAFEPIHIRGQMIFKKICYIKMMVSAVSTGILSLSLMAMLPPTHDKFQRVCIHFYTSLSDKGVLACTIGGTLTGIGMALCGSCPLLTYVQLGAGVPNLVYTMAGCAAGVLIHALLKPYTDKVTKPFFRSSTNPWIESSYFITALPLVAMFGMLVFAFELLIPWTAEVKVKSIQPYLERKGWAPHVTGCIMGLLHLPLVLGAERGLGDIGSLSTVISQIFVGPLRKLSPFMARQRFNYWNWTQVFFVIGVVGGAYYSCNLSNSLSVAKGVSPVMAFIGGLLMMYGAHMAGGASVFHGQTGMGLLSILSIICMTFTATSSITTAYIMKASGVLNPDVKA